MEPERLLQARPVARQVDRDHRERAAARPAASRSRRARWRGAARDRARPPAPAPNSGGVTVCAGAALDRDRHLVALEALPAAVVAVALGIVGVQFEDEQVLLVDMEIGAPEREAIGVALHDPGQPGRAAADHVEPRRGQMRDMARAKAADAEMRIVGQDRPPGRGARRRDRPGVAAGIGALAGSVIVPGRRLGPERQPPQPEHAEIRVAHRRDVEPLGHRHRPRGPQRRDDRVEIEQPQRRQPRAAHLVVGVAARHPARQHQVAHVPFQRRDAEDADIRAAAARDRRAPRRSAR